MNLTLDERTKIFDKVCRLVATKHFDPGMNGVDWNGLARERRDQILAGADPEVFETEVNKLVMDLKTSHTGFAMRERGIFPLATQSTPPSSASAKTEVSAGCFKTCIKGGQRSQQAYALAISCSNAADEKFDRQTA
jgi:hypothetical protein